LEEECSEKVTIHKHIYGAKIIAHWWRMIVSIPSGITDFKSTPQQNKRACFGLALKFHETEDYTIYPAPMITVTKNRFAKHYFIGDKRVASKLGVGKFSNVYGINGNNVTAGALIPHHIC